VRQGKSTLAARQALLREHREHVVQQLAQLQQALKIIDRKVALYDQWTRKHGPGGELG
jgi:DNA-binding transcriptional MerR regulator